jgi:hypothetical protein
MSSLCQVCQSIDFETVAFGHSSFENSRNDPRYKIGPLLRNIQSRWSRPTSYPYRTLGEKVVLGTVADVQRRASRGCPLCSLLLDSPLEYEGYMILLHEQSPHFQDAARDGHLRFEKRLWQSNDKLLEKSGALCISLKFTRDWHVRPAAMQKCSSALCLLDHPESKFYRMTKFADYGLLRRWLEECRLHHNSCKDLDMSFRHYAFIGFNRARPLRLIDTETGFIHRTKDLPSLTYACLSYVWGEIGVQETLRKNTPGWRYDRSGERTSVPLPRRVSETIRDAMIVTKELDLRYLWVDALCIVQDDFSEKYAQMAVMAQIYSHAAVCLIAAAGSDANAGLPGVTSARSLWHQSAIEVDNGLWIGKRMPGMALLLDESHWMTRGWTYQEFFFSRRCLVFTESETFWYCGVLTHRESRDEEYAGRSENYLDLARNRADDPANTSLTIGNWITASSNKDRICLWEFYRVCVSEYSQRNLTYHEDSVDAFRSLAQSFSTLYRTRENPQPVRFNIPEGILLAALYWKRHKNAPRLTRRQKLGSPLFPSWCWAAWQGHVVYDRVPFESATAIHPGTELEIIEPNLIPAVPALDLIHDFSHVPSDDDSGERIYGLLPSVAVLADMDLANDDVDGRVRVLNRRGLVVGWCEFDDDRLPFIPECCTFIQLGVSETQNARLRCHALAVELLIIPITMTLGVRKGEAFLDNLLHSLRQDESYLEINDEDLHLQRFATLPSSFVSQGQVPEPPSRRPIYLARRIGIASIDLPDWEVARDETKSIVLLG